MSGHYAFGGRTGGSIMIYGSIYLTIGLLLSHGFQTAIELFPRPVLGVILAFEGLVLIRLIRGPFGCGLVGTVRAHFLKARLSGPAN